MLLEAIALYYTGVSCIVMYGLATTDIIDIMFEDYGGGFLDCLYAKEKKEIVPSIELCEL